jgi:hypothetical protein
VDVGAPTYLILGADWLVLVEKTGLKPTLQGLVRVREPEIVRSTRPGGTSPISEPTPRRVAHVGFGTV